MRAGKCAICGKDKQNLTDHHVREGKSGPGIVLIICQECHTTVEQYKQALARYTKEN